MPPQSLEALRALGNSAPVAALLGMCIERIEPGYARVVIPFKPELMQAHGRVHGGIFGLLADTAGYFAAASMNERDGVTLEYKLNLLEGVDGLGLVSEARVVKAGRTVTLCDVEVRSEDGRLVAKGLATYRFAAPRRPSGDSLATGNP